MEQRKRKDVEKIAEEKTVKALFFLSVFTIVMLIITDFLMIKVLGAKNTLKDEIKFYGAGMLMILFFWGFKPFKALIKECFVYKIQYEIDFAYEQENLSSEKSVEVDLKEGNSARGFVAENEAMFAIIKGEYILITVGSKNGNERKRVYEILPRGCFSDYYKIVEKWSLKEQDYFLAPLSVRDNWYNNYLHYCYVYYESWLALAYFFSFS